MARKIEAHGSVGADAYRPHSGTCRAWFHEASRAIRRSTGDPGPITP